VCLNTCSNLQPPDTSDQRFPTGAVFIAAFIPTLLGLLTGYFILPIGTFYDAAAGLWAYIHFSQGGAWNTLPVPNPDNIAETIEVAVTWWPPGQYLFVGLLHSMGLTLGQAALFLTAICNVAGSIGLSFLAKELGVQSRALPLISLVNACAFHNLWGFTTYYNGEPLVMAIWPWVAIAAWRFRDNNKLLIPTLPILFLIGSFIKYSFAIYALCILLFLWSEKLIALRSVKAVALWERVKGILAPALPLVIVGVIYIMGSYCLLGGGETPAQKSPAYHYSLKEILAYAPISPLTSLDHLKDSFSRYGSRLIQMGRVEFETQAASILAFVSPLAIILYAFLIVQRKPLLRFLGVTSLTTASILSIFHLLDYAISLEDRHYQQAGSLLLIAILAYSLQKRRASRLALVFVMAAAAWGVYRFTRATHISLKYHAPIYVGEHGFSVKLPEPVRTELESIAKHGDSILAVYEPAHALWLETVRHRSARLLPVNVHGISIAPSYKGRVSLITIASPGGYTWISPENLKPLFADYRENEWSSYMVGDWTFWQARYSGPVEQE